MFGIHKAKRVSGASVAGARLLALLPGRTPTPQKPAAVGGPRILTDDSIAGEGCLEGCRTSEGMGIPEALQTSGRTRHFLLEPFAFYEFNRSCFSLVPPLVAPFPRP